MDKVGNMRTIKQVLSIAGSDSGGGAGIQADLKTFQMRSVFGTSVITAVTAQNTLGVFDIHAIPCHNIQAQLTAIAADFDISATKIGMLASSEIIETVATSLRSQHFGSVVLDPVMVAKGGACLLPNDAICALKQLLLPLADVLTPNLPEAEALTGVRIIDKKTLQQAAAQLQNWGAKTVIIKGGHAQHSTSTVCQDWVFLPNGEQLVLESPRVHTPHTHGTGCTFSACLTAELGKGRSLTQAARTAKAFISAAITQTLNIGHGHGPTNHWAYRE